MKRLAVILTLAAVAACTEEPAQVRDYYGTLEPFASEAIYFVVTDRFVDGDPSNNHETQGSDELRTFDRPVQIEDLPPGNVGYLGGDFRGILNNAGYIADMGFTALWLTPIIDNPDEAFTGGKPPGAGGSNDLGKTGYHGYWGVNFFELDEHLPSTGLDFADLTAALAGEFGMKTVLDVVCNHGSPSFSMPADQPKYGELYDAEGRLVADHQNLHPSELDDDNPLHAFYRRSPDLAELSDLDFENPDVLDYCAAAQGKWVAQGADAVRIDTFKHMPFEFWKAFADRMRAIKPGLFMFGEAWSFDVDELAPFTHAENGRISVLDFPGRAAMAEVFSRAGAPYTMMTEHLHLESGAYQNPYELMTFYDNHDMPRLDADELGFIDANNWLFTARGIPVVYYGSEMAFRAGRDQHSGNRDYYGQDNVERAKQHPIYAALREVATLRKQSPALQGGLQVNLDFDDDTAAFYRVYQHGDTQQTALVLLNKGDTSVTRTISRFVNAGEWRDALNDTRYRVGDAESLEDLEVPAHGMRVLLLDGPVTHPLLIAELDRLQSRAEREAN